MHQKSFMTSLKTKRVHSSNKNFHNLITQLDNALNGKYQETQKEYNKYNKIESLDTVIVVFDEEKPVGCGCFKQFGGDKVEIKRMYVSSDYRGKGISKLILGELEAWAKDLGFTKAILETGLKQAEAIGLYSKYGYHKIENYGQYKNLPNSLCFEKAL